MKHKNLSNQTIKTTSITLVFTLVFGVFTQLHAAPPQPENVTVSGDETKPTVSWGSVEAETNGVDWTEETGSASWSERQTHTSVVFDGKLWVMGGRDNSGTLLNDVWYTDDGKNWTEATSNADWSARRFHTSVVFDGKLWILGGFDDATRFNDVWYSEDGVNWTEATSSAGWTERNQHTSVVFNNKLWVMGGRNNSGTLLNDVWYTEDGKNWAEATGSAAWSPRGIHTSTVYDNKLWVIGGQGSGENFNDAWHSKDGENWAQSTDNAAWSARWGHGSAVFDNKLWVMGGYGSDKVNDVWSSQDGVEWAKASADAGWSSRWTPTTASYKNRLWVLGGAGSFGGGGNFNDVWSTPNNSISHYKICWDKTEGECGSSVKVNPSGEVISLNSSNSGWLTKLKDALVPGANAQSGELSHILEDELDSGTWYFSVTAVTMAGEESTSPGTATHTIAGLPDTGYGPQGSGYLVYVLAATGGMVVLAGGYYWKRKSGNR